MPFHATLQVLSTTRQSADWWRVGHRRVRQRATAQTPSPQQQAFRDIYRELIEIDTTDSNGDTLKAAEAMAARLKAAGFPAGDIRVISTGPRKGNLVARLRGAGARKPLLLLAHIDVVPAGDGWQHEPFEIDRGRRLFPWPRRHRRQGDGGDLPRQPDRISPRRFQGRPRHHPGADDRRGARALAAQWREMDTRTTSAH